jgi:hypothetical protein
MVLILLSTHVFFLCLSLVSVSFILYCYLHILQLHSASLHHRILYIYVCICNKIYAKMQKKIRFSIKYTYTYVRPRSLDRELLQSFIINSSQLISHVRTALNSKDMVTSGTGVIGQ